MNKPRNTNNPTFVSEQYGTPVNLQARIALHERFSLNPYDWMLWVLDQIGLGDEACVFEVGCGTGRLWKTNADRLRPGWDITLSDQSAGMVAQARAALAGVAHPFRFEVCPADRIPREEASVDAVIANHMLYHVPDRPRAFAEIRRALKPGGQLYAATNGERHMMELWQLLEPYIPDCYTRALAAAGGFLLENGAAQLEAGGFVNVTLYNRPDALEITEVEPLIAYIQSSNTLMNHAWTEAELDAIHAEVAARIAAGGTFHVSKVAGLFMAYT